MTASLIDFAICFDLLFRFSVGNSFGSGGIRYRACSFVMSSIVAMIEPSDFYWNFYCVYCKLVYSVVVVV